MIKLSTVQIFIIRVCASVEESHYEGCVRCQVRSSSCPLSFVSSQVCVCVCVCVCVSTHTCVTRQEERSFYIFLYQDVWCGSIVLKAYTVLALTGNVYGADEKWANRGNFQHQ